MTMSRPRHPLAAGAALAGAAALLVLAACEVPRPTEVSPAGEMPLASIRSGGAYRPTGELTPAIVREAVLAALNVEDVTAARGTPVMLYFIADASGRVVHAEYQRERASGGAFSFEPSRSEAAEAQRAKVRVRASAAGGDGAAAGRYEMNASPLPGRVAEIDPAAIGSIDILKANAGQIVADVTNVVWVTLKEGATLESSRLTGEALREARARQQRKITTERAEAAGMTPMPGSAPAGAMRLRVGGDGAGASEPPLYVIDGVVVKASEHETRVKGLDPETIASINVLKGSAATTKYGDDGRHGVIEITLKK